MSILIKGMEMPKSCVDCNMPMEWCNKWIGVENGKRSEDCPLVPVPPHGRLIDEELPTAKHWDGHTEKDVTRLLSLDVRPVVLCRDCRHWEYDAIFFDGWCRGRQQGNPNWYCADGEKREES